MEDVSSYFGAMVFNDEAMRLRLPKDVYRQLKQTVGEGKDLDIDIANSVAHAMKTWAMENGATHYTHWFQPMTGITAEKHEAFISPQGGGRVIMEFSGRELIKGEPDASSFPSGGIRATFEARGYTAWDPTSYAFIKDGTLCIPTAFCAYSGEVLDKKTPLLRSMEALSEQAVRILHLFGKNDVRRVMTTVGAEQEYFLIDKKDYEKRPDLVLTGRTLVGARSPKGQELNDHYFGALRTRVAAYMKDLDRELWKLGIYAKTSHNEVAPCQHELAPVFISANVAVDQNQLTMELMKKVAERHDFACLLHEKPFAGLNGSGKHNNWSISAEGGVNLLEPGDNPRDNAQFLLFLVAVIRAVDDYQDLLRVSVASAGNDHRLGGYEAPPAIISIFLGDELTEILEGLSNGEDVSGRGEAQMKLGVHVLPPIPRDTTDRNRTSPFAFTGNKFEFRMLGSSFSVADPNTILNTAVAKSLKDFYEELKDADDFESAVQDIVRRTWQEHRRIVFNGNNYAPEWVSEATRRGLLNLKCAPDAYDSFLLQKNIDLFAEFHIFNSVEMHARHEILHEEYSKTVRIEAVTLVDMMRRQVIPAVSAYTDRLSKAVADKRAAVPGLACKAEVGLLTSLSGDLDELLSRVEVLDGMNSQSASLSGSELSHWIHDNIVPQMEAVRDVCDRAELKMDKEAWPYPTYGEMLYYI